MNQKAAQIIHLKNNDDTVVELQKEIDDYKRNAALVARLLHDVEVQRTRVINQIEEATHNGLDKRTAHRLEDKLARPYAMQIYNL